MFGFGQDIGIDLGTATVIAYVKGKGIVLDFCQTYDICRCNFQSLESGITVTGRAYFVKINSNRQ